jgi:hypothetical protein
MLSNRQEFEPSKNMCIFIVLLLESQIGILVPQRPISGSLLWISTIASDRALDQNQSPLRMIEDLDSRGKPES